MEGPEAPRSLLKKNLFHQNEESRDLHEASRVQKEEFVPPI